MFDKQVNPKDKCHAIIVHGRGQLNDVFLLSPSVRRDNVRKASESASAIEDRREILTLQT